MISFTGWQYLLIDVANQYGLDKLLFEQRIKWTEDNLDCLETLADKAEKKPMYIKAVMAIRKAQNGLPTGHMVGFDAVCSGVQIMSAVTGCMAGATATGLIDPNVRADAYSSLTKTMQDLLPSGFTIARADAKRAMMTSFYGSKAEPIAIFGEDTPEINAFYAAASTIAPGAWELLQDLLSSWQAYDLVHSWKMPDGFDARVKVMEKIQARIEVDELDHATFTYEFYENKGQNRGLSNAANVVHSLDAYVLRSIHRRCNYDPSALINGMNLIQIELNNRHLGFSKRTRLLDEKSSYYLEQYSRSGIADVVILPYLHSDLVSMMDTEHLEKLLAILDSMAGYAPFEVIAIHDDFKCHANNMNYLRQQYKNILAELSESNILSDVLGQIMGTSITYKKLSNDLGTSIRKSNYALT